MTPKLTACGYVPSLSTVPFPHSLSCPQVRTYARPLPQNYGYEAQFVPPQIIDDVEVEVQEESRRARPKVQRAAPPPKDRSESPEIKIEKKKLQRCK